MTGSGADAENAAAPFPCNCSARCFRAECAKIPRAASAKLHKIQFLCIAKRVIVHTALLKQMFRIDQESEWY